MKEIFITGGTGYIGKRLIKQLLQRGHTVTALVRKGSEQKLAPGVKAIIADPFDADSFQSFIPENSVFVQLLGVAHPSPKKARQFMEIDLASVKASADAAARAGVAHFIYISVAMSPSRFMAAYQDARQKGEEYCRRKGLNCTIIRPWYVFGPGHFWPFFLLPLYGVSELVPSWKKKARSMALVTIRQMLRTILAAVEDNPSSTRIIEIPSIRKARS